jgi:DeoR family fructose operon transcriptional repressor
VLLITCALFQASQQREQKKDAIKSAGFVSASELATRFNSSLSTVRRDLIELENEGLIVRTRGGGQNAPNLVLSAAATSRAPQHSDEKARIARKAVEFIAEAGCIVLDGGYDDAHRGSPTVPAETTARDYRRYRNRL